MKKLIYLLLITGTLTGCGFTYEKHITGNYFLIGVDDTEDITLSFYHADNDVYEGVVGGGVFELSLNDKYFVVKCHPYIDEYTRRLARDKVECYIVEISNEDHFYDKSIYGPYSEKELAAKMREMNIDDVELFFERKRR